MKKPTSFCKLHTSEKVIGKFGKCLNSNKMWCVLVMLSWFVDRPVIENILKSDMLIEEEDVECRPEKISDSVLDENVDIHLVRQYFSSDAWALITDVLEQKIKNHVWVCHSCHHDLHSFNSINCDACLHWYHFKCVGIKNMPKFKNWFCRSCVASSKED